MSKQQNFTTFKSILSQYPFESLVTQFLLHCISNIYWISLFFFSDKILDTYNLTLDILFHSRKKRRVINKNISFLDSIISNIYSILSFICEDLRQLDVSRAYILTLTLTPRLRGKITLALLSSLNPSFSTHTKAIFMLS